MRTIGSEFCGLMGEISPPSMSSDLSAVERSDPNTRMDPQALSDIQKWDPNTPTCSSSMGMIPEGDSPEELDPCDDVVLKYINQMLMEEDLGGKTCMFQDSLALQAFEKSFYDALSERHPWSSSEDHGVTKTESVGVSGRVGGDLELSSPKRPGVDISFSENTWQADSLFSNSTSCDSVNGCADSPVSTLPDPNSLTLRHPLKCCGGWIEEDSTGRSRSSSKGSKGRKNHERVECYDSEENRSNKQSAINSTEVELSEMFDTVLLCPDTTDEPAAPCGTDEAAAKVDASCKSLQSGEQLKRRKGRGWRRGRRQGKKEEGRKKEMVDLMSLLIQCAQAVASNDHWTALEGVKKIREHSSPTGDGPQRLAHCFADGLEARLAGRVGQLHASYVALLNKRTPASDILKAYHVYVSSCPFKKCSNMFANRTIVNVAEKATKLHIIDFGILYGFQWPCLIRRISTRPGGPPELRITGIDLTQPGFRPTERVEETGLRLADYCKRFNVSFKYTAIAKKWETIQLEDIGIEEDEFLVVNCLYRFDNLLDDTVLVDNPRDAVLSLIKRINPNIFIHGITNGTYNAPFFLTRFREALFHFSSLFDMIEACMAHEEEARARFEIDLFGRDAINVIACEGTERVVRPETYKQWQVRNVRSGFMQIPLKRDILNQVRTKVKSGYHKDFVVDEDGCWMLQGWKGRIIFALSCWKPA